MFLLRSLNWKNEIHRYKLDVESLDNVRRNLSASRDCTKDVFTNNRAVSGSMKEIEALEHQREVLLKNISEMKQRLHKYEERFAQLEELIKENDRRHYTDKENGIRSIQIVEVQEQERQRIARDLHDSLVQKLTALIHKGEFVQQVVETDQLRAKLELEVINKVLKECIEEFRTTIYNLHPMALDDLGLKTALIRCVEQNASQTNMDIEYEIDEQIDSKKISSVISITIIRIIQELCSNSIKYSGGSKIGLKIYIKKKDIIIEQRDNGSGFDFEHITVSRGDNTGFGIPMLKERIALLGGTIRAAHSETDGMEYCITIPYSVKMEE